MKNKYVLAFLICCFLFQFSIGQNLRQIIEYEKNGLISAMYYKSDSLIYGHSHYDDSWYFFNGKNWASLGIKDGLLYTAPYSKIYHISNSSFSIINSVTQKVEKSYAINIKNIPYDFKVFNDSFFFATDSSGIGIYQYNFNNKTINKSYSFSYGSVLNIVEDTIMYYGTGNDFFRKNIKTGIVSKIEKPYYKIFKCDKNNVLFINGDKCYVSENYGQTFKFIDFSKYSQVYDFSVNLKGQNISFIDYNLKFKTVDFSGSEKNSVDIYYIYKLNTGPYPLYCDHHSGDYRFQLQNDTTWILCNGDGDIFKVNPGQNKIKYLGGPFNLGIKYLKINHQGNLFFDETVTGVWAFSSDTGKTWNIPEFPYPKKLKKAEFVDSSIFILSENKLSRYTFGKHEIDTSFYTLGLKIIDFDIIDYQTLILFTTSGNYKLKMNTKALVIVGSTSPFNNYIYLKKTKRCLAFASVDFFYSDDFGKTWNKSLISGYDFFNSIEFDKWMVSENSKDVISIKVKFNGQPALLKSNDGGKNFIFHYDSILANSIAGIELYDNVYSLDKTNNIKKFDNYLNGKVIDKYNNKCPAIGMQAVDSGFYIWNSRAEIFYKKVPYQKVYAYSEKINLFPNPVNSNSSLNFSIPKDYFGRITEIELFDMMGKKQESVSFDYSEEQNIYEVKNLPNKASQFYVVVIKMLDGMAHRQKVFIY